ncbi:MAG: SPOR domain-containing protein [Mameliella sp.]|nr:SPOR domain-containing protein [Phaeodactylibacter sp.]NRA50755.1 SPOR domain-containing protein [Phaeodactylibacter sp.]
MKTLLTLAVLLPSFCLIAADSFTEPNPLPFTASDFMEVQEKAKVEGKLYFLHFTAAHVDQCKWMEANTFSNEKLTSYIERTYLGAEVDIETPDGARLQHQFDVNQLPTTLFFSTKGELLGGLTGQQTADNMLFALRRYDTPEHRIMPSKAKGGVARPVAYKAVDRKISRPRLIPDVSDILKQNPYKPLEQTKKPQAVATEKPYKNQYTSIYNRPQSTQASNRPQAYYSVQLGVFSNHQNAYKEKAKLERYGTSGHLIHVKTKNGVKYRLCTGAFISKADAGLHQKKMVARYPDSFVKWVQK